MPYVLELGSGAHKFMDKAIVVNTQSHHHFSNNPIPIEKAKAQVRFLRGLEHGMVPAPHKK
jgi:hypothetical protein